jgi:hypothetical protein
MANDNKLPPPKKGKKPKRIGADMKNPGGPHTPGAKKKKKKKKRKSARGY